VLPARVRDYSPAMLDELTATGEVLWSGSGALPGNDGWISLHLADTVAVTLPDQAEPELSPLEQEILAALGGGGAYFFRQLSDAVGSLDDEAMTTAVWNLVWGGLVTNDTFAPLRALVGTGHSAHRQPRRPVRARSFRGRSSLPRPTLPSRSGAPVVGGRWSIVPLAEGEPTVRAAATAEILLDRHGVVTRGAVASEGVPGGFALVYKTLSAFEDSGKARRGYFISSLGAAQFATSGAVDRLRSFSRDPGDERREVTALALAATDPANPYGAALPWPQLEGHRPGRKAGGLVVLVDGDLALYLERGGKTMLTFTQEPGALTQATAALADLVKSHAVDKLAIEKVNGEFVLGTEAGRALEAAGFSPTPRGLRLRA
jgi:ATP-dependent Lhr-like helicase